MTGSRFPVRYYIGTMQDARRKRFVLVAVAALGAGLAVAQWWGFLSNRSHMMRQATELELEAQDRLPLYRERDVARAQVRLLKHLILKPTADLDAYAQQLERARALAQELAPQLPAAWEVPWALGASTYLQWTLRRDERLIRQSDAWHEPLQCSIDLAPGNLEPARFLAIAYMELWPMLTPERRQQAEPIVERTLQDPVLFEALIATWLERAAHRDEAFEAIPDRPDTWRRVRQLYASGHRWEAFLHAHDRYLDALARYHDAQLEEAEVRRAGGDLRRARGQFLNVAIELQPASPRDDERLQQAVLRSPAGANRVPALIHPLERLLRLGLLRPLPVAPAVVLRLTGLADELPESREALALALGGELTAAERLEAQAGADLWTPTWTPYLLAKADLLLDQLRPAEARTALNRITGSWSESLPYWRLEERWAQAVDNSEALATARERLADFDRPVWPAEAWRQEGEVFYLEWQSARPVETLIVGFGRVAAEGAVIEVRLDGYILDAVVARSGRRVHLEPAEPLAAGEAHILEVERLAGGGWRPGPVVLQAAPGS